MRYSVIKKYDIANAKGINTSIFFCGCNHHCKGCFNQSLWDFNNGKIFDGKAKELLYSYLNDKEVLGLSVLGGEPLQQGEEMFYFLKEVKEKFPSKSIWLWTGYYLNELNEKQKKIVNLCDFIIDGRFEEDKTDGRIILRGSTNQTIWYKNDGVFKRSPYNDFMVK